MFATPLRDRLNRLSVEEEVFEARERPVRVDASALAENIAVAFVIIARRAGMQQEALLAASTLLMKATSREFGQIERRQTF